MHAAAVILLALAGLLAGWAAWLRWAGLAAAEEDDRDRRWLGPAWAAFAALTLGLILSLAEAGHRDLSYFTLAIWAAAGAVLFAGRFLASPSRALLLLPIGAVALLIAMASAWRLGAGAGDVVRLGGTPVIVWIHVVLIIAAMAALTVAGAAGGLYHLAHRSLKRDQARGLRLAPLPQVERLIERTLVLGTGLLSAGLATGGAAIQLSPDFSLANPTTLVGIAHLGLLVIALGLRAGGRLGRRALATVALASLALTAAVGVSLILIRHGIG